MGERDRDDERRRRPWRRLGAAALAASLVFGGTACGATDGEAQTRAAVRGAASAQTPAATGQAEVTRRLRELEASYHGRIGAFAIDTGTGRTVGHRTHERFPSNSTFKAVLCGAILHKARTADPGLMERRHYWTAEEAKKAGHAPVTSLPENIENGLTTAELCHATITVSDNGAANVLLKQIGGPKGLTRYYRSLGDPVGRLDTYEPELNEWEPGQKSNTIMPAFMARDLAKLTTGDALVPEDRRQLNEWLKATTTGGTRIRAGLPDDWTVGNKTGTGGGTYATASDIAVAWRPSGAPLIFAVYTHRDGRHPEIDDGVIAQTASILARGLGATS
ncbi:beta-lactamase [Actinomadura rubrobrunea]|uniref:Beta-lactamase n=1 Tax=Actinomadura rubrobrunea TaxID=115335 RepID=A0A9W6UTQ4_9ACTN|nr:class A beta-lactamase [Actinomadura rubrobrunea]GLW62028.1 beta-lactamase [Actinomadura rubrobrunea]